MAEEKMDAKNVCLEILLDIKEEKIKMKQGITEKYFTLREMTGFERDAYMMGMGKRMQDKEGVEGIMDFENIQADLISRCLYDNNNALVTVAVISKWPASAQQTLFDKCEEINGLKKNPAKKA